jgi:hypothetical protein
MQMSSYSGANGAEKYRDCCTADPLTHRRSPSYSQALHQQEQWRRRNVFVTGQAHHLSVEFQPKGEAP